MAALATAASMLLIYIPLAARHWISLDIFAIHFVIFMMIPYGLGIITSVQEERLRREGGKELKKGMHWIPGVIIVFFIVLATVDSIIITFATKGIDGDLARIVLPKSISGDTGEGIQSKFVGTVPYDLQDEEEKFDLYVEQLKQQKQRGWQVKGGWVDKPLLNQDSVFELKIMDKEGEQITDAVVDVSFLRSSHMGADRHYDLTEKEPGHYSETINLNEPGCWQLKILVKRGEDIHEVRGDTEVAELIDGKIVNRECVDGEPEMDSAL